MQDVSDGSHPSRENRMDGVDLHRCSEWPHESQLPLEGRLCPTGDAPTGDSPPGDICWKMLLTGSPSFRRDQHSTMLLVWQDAHRSTWTRRAVGTARVTEGGPRGK